MGTRNTFDATDASQLRSEMKALRDDLSIMRRDVADAEMTCNAQAETIQDQARLIVSLREQLRLAHDNMAEQVRQARWEVAESGLEMSTTLPGVIARLERIRDANAPKD